MPYIEGRDIPISWQIALPDGFECTLMETASGSVKATGTVPLDFSDTFAGIAELHMSDQGIVR